MTQEEFYNLLYFLHYYFNWKEQTKVEQVDSYILKETIFFNLN